MLTFMGSWETSIRRDFCKGRVTFTGTPFHAAIKHGDISMHQAKNWQELLEQGIRTGFLYISFQCPVPLSICNRESSLLNFIVKVSSTFSMFRFVFSIFCFYLGFLLLKILESQGSRGREKVILTSIYHFHQLQGDGETNFKSSLPFSSNSLFYSEITSTSWYY